MKIQLKIKKCANSRADARKMHSSSDATQFTKQTKSMLNEYAFLPKGINTYFCYV